jgi:hypothetical protein
MKKLKRQQRDAWWIRANTLSRKQQARCICNDCGVNVIEIGEYFMLNLDIWKNQLGLGAWDNLCIGCIEARLGRKIWLPDICNAPNFPWMRPTSDRLRDRLGFEKDRNGKWRRKSDYKLRKRAQEIKAASAIFSHQKAATSENPHQGTKKEPAK